MVRTEATKEIPAAEFVAAETEARNNRTYCYREKRHKYLLVYSFIFFSHTVVCCTRYVKRSAKFRASSVMW